MNFKIFGKSYKNIWLILVLFFIFVISLIYNIIPNSKFWDEGIYITNGKYIFSNGNIGSYEIFRPPMLGLVTGLFWKIGLNVVLFSKLFIFFCFILSLFFVYKISEELWKDSGFLSSLFLVSSFLYFNYINRILTGIPSIAFSLISLNLLLKKKYYLSGLFLSIAFLFRFTAGLLVFVYFIYFIYDSFRNKSLFRKNAKYFLIFFLGFMTLVSIYLFMNYIFLGSAIYPIIFAQKILKAGPQDLKTNGLLFFSEVLALQNLSILFFLFFLFLILFRKLRGSKYILILSSSLFYFLYFILLPHREARYILIALPYFSIISGIVIKYISLKYKNLKDKVKYIYILLFILFLFISFLSIKYRLENKIQQQEIEYYTYFSDKDPNNILVYNPKFGIYSNNKFDFLINTYRANKSIYENPKKYTFIAFPGRFLNCNDIDINCNKDRNNFKNILDENWSLVDTFYFLNQDHFIYKHKN